VTIVHAPGTVGRNSTASVTAQTAPGAACSIVVMYKSGPSGAQGLGPKRAGADGQVSWSWKVGGNTTRGTWPVTITCGGQRAQTSVTVP
jgi:micrococcal nuclease